MPDPSGGLFVSTHRTLDLQEIAEADDTLRWPLRGEAIDRPESYGGTPSPGKASSWLRKYTRIPTTPFDSRYPPVVSVSDTPRANVR